MKAALSRLAVALGAVLMALLAIPTTLGFALLCLVRTTVDRLTKCLDLWQKDARQAFLLAGQNHTVF